MNTRNILIVITMIAVCAITVMLFWENFPKAVLFSGLSSLVLMLCFKIAEVTHREVIIDQIIPASLLLALIGVVMAGTTVLSLMQDYNTTQKQIWVGVLGIGITAITLCVMIFDEFPEKEN